MSWITRCPDCTAVYKVGSAQLQQAHGWLRCGTCQHVFDSTGRVVAADVIPTLTDRVNVGAPQLGRVDLELMLHKESPAPAADEPVKPAVASPPTEPSPISAFEDALQSFKLPDGPLSPEAGENAHTEEEPQASSVPSPVSVASKQPKATVILMSLLLATALVQCVFAWRSVILTHWPQWGRAAALWCGSATCRAQWQPPLSVWSLKAQPLTMEDSGYRVSWSLMHTAPTPLSVPALELALLNGQGQALSMQPLASALTAAPSELAPGQIWQGSLHVALPAGLDASQAQLRLVPH